MAKDTWPTKRHRFAASLDLPAALTALGVEVLDVSSERAIVVASRSVLDIVVVEGALSDARAIEVGVIDYPADAPKEPDARIETLLERLENAQTPADRGPLSDSGTNLS
ncbi:hypothetical protein GS429_07105 [Natronorubrum sp. JWXQ-INN-674]|uniref:Uncharacterized protein n=1 Tax=Natronorubrum halalkaliphilum TaxID=2691917 RepID=A0A6B0VL48_9EURY|nr:hypothetical protein [Natronorubrum halalkaliphilum]MXV61837.1 hypothetical protein [Natronorubrum halalkaliphilum]